MKPKIKTTCTKLQLQLLSFCLLCLSGKTRCDGNGPDVVTVEQGRDAVLPCSLSSKENIESYRFDWKKPAQIDGRQKEVFQYDAGVTYDSGQAGQSEQFKGRVSHFPEELKHGNAAIIIRNTKMADSGDYTCVFPNLQPPQTFHIELVVEPVVIIVEEDGDALLPCSLSTKENIEQGYFDWNKVAQNNEKQKEVFLCNKGRHSPSFGSQDEEFKGRVSHFPQELKHGNASIIIRNTKMADSGDYTCTLTESRQTFHIKLVVGPVLKDRSGENIRAKTPFITALEQTKDWSRLQCEVQGASPKPKVEWKDSSGNILLAEPQVTDRGGSYDIILQTTVTKTDLYHCVVTQEESNHQTEAKIHVYISGSSTGWTVGVGVGGVGVGVGVGVIVGAAFWRNKKKTPNKGSPADPKEGSAVPLNGRHRPAAIKVLVSEGSDVTLPCSLSTKENIQQNLFDWRKHDGMTGVFMYDKGLHHNNGGSGQDEQFKGRVFHFQDELKHGNASIIIRNTKMADSGDYTCFFPLLQTPQIFHIDLVVVSSLRPNIRILDATDDGVQLQCEVHGASPKPKVEWKDSDGNILPAEEPQVTDRGGSHDIILQTTVTRTDRYRCVVTQEEINHQIHAEEHKCN
ncbi:hypothetical protein ABVT39_027628 [Epinephelus coioides]